MSDYVGYTGGGSKVHRAYRNTFGQWLTECTSYRVEHEADTWVESDMCLRCWPEYEGGGRYAAGKPRHPL